MPDGPIQMPPSLVPTEQGMPSPLVARVLAEARARLGQREQGGQNKGPIVREVFAPFLSPARLERVYATGKLQWCAAFACFCWWKVWSGMRRLMRSEVPKLWAVFSQQKDADGNSWTWVRTAEGRAPQPGDFVFFGEGPDHVGLVERVDGDLLHAIEGNARADKDDTGSTREKSYHWAGPHAEARVFGFARVYVEGAAG